VDSIPSHPLYPHERTPLLVENEAGWAPKGSESFGEEQNLFPLAGVGTPASPSRILVTKPTELLKLPANHVCWHKRPTV